MIPLGALPRDTKKHRLAAVLFLFSFLLLDEKEAKNQGRLHRTSARPSKGLTLRSRSTFCEGKRQAPLREGQALSRRSRARWPLVSLSPLTTHFRLKPSSRALTRDLLNRQRTIFLVVALRIGSAESSICFVVPPRNDRQSSRRFDSGNMNAAHACRRFA